MRRMPCPSNSSSIPLRRLFVDHCRNPSLFPSRISNSSDDNDDSEDYAFRVAVAFLFHHCRKGIIITITTNWRKKTTKAIGTKKNEMQQARPSIMQLEWLSSSTTNSKPATTVNASAEEEEEEEDSVCLYNIIHLLITTMKTVPITKQCDVMLLLEWTTKRRMEGQQST